MPSAMKSPSRNMPISTVMIAATVVERFAPIERSASVTKSLACSLRSAVASAALVADDDALLERDHAPAHLVDHLAVVRGHEDGRAGAVDAVEELHDPDRGVGVEVAGRLVADEERRVVHERARDRDALLLAARELVREAVHLRAEADEREDLRHLRPDRGLRLALHLERVGDVLVRGAVGEELEVLEDAADVAAQHRHLAPPQARELAAADDDPAVRSGSSSLRRSRMIVDLPEPDGPTRKTNSPLSMTKRDVVGGRRRSARRPSSPPRRRSSASRTGARLRRRRARPASASASRRSARPSSARAESSVSGSVQVCPCTGFQAARPSRGRTGRLSASSASVADTGRRPSAATRRRLRWPWRGGRRG